MIGSKEEYENSAVGVGFMSDNEKLRNSDYEQLRKSLKNEVGGIIKNNLGIIYKATNKTNGKCYVGQTIKSLNKRKYYHNWDSKRHNHKFACAIKKYGIDGFNWEVICEDILEKHLDEYEVFYIDFYSSFRMGYNCSEGGKAHRGYKHTDKTRRKISKALKGKKRTEEHCKNLSKNHSDVSGEKHPQAKLTWEKVAEIREKYKTRKYTHKQLGKEYGVDPANIFYIINNKTWKGE